MDSDFQEIEDALKGMPPATPDAACLDRLLAAVEGRLQDPPVSVSGIEGKLAALRPAALPADYSAALLQTVSRVPFPVDGKVVLFPGARKKIAKAGTGRRPWYAAAAAVAMAGAFSALMIDAPKDGARARIAGKEAPADGTFIPAGGNPANFVPASMGSGLQDVTDLGVRWTRDGRPVRVYRVVYRDKVKLKNDRGEIIEVEKPREQYLLAPEKID